MKKMVFTGLIVGAAIVAGLLFGSVAQAQSIGVQLVGGGGGGGANTSMGATEVAGAVVRQMNWNPVTGAAGAGVALEDSNGMPTPAVVTFFGSANTWSFNIPDMPGDNRLMRGYIDTTATSPTVVVINNVPYANYDVYLYADGDNGGSTRQGVYYVNSLLDNQICVDPAGQNFNGTYINGQNYLVFPNQTHHMCIILVQPDQSVGGFRAALNGIQIVNHTGD
jgi:hypothetical protein